MAQDLLAMVLQFLYVTLQFLAESVHVTLDGLESITSGVLQRVAHILHTLNDVINMWLEEVSNALSNLCQCVQKSLVLGEVTFAHEISKCFLDGVQASLSEVSQNIFQLLQQPLW